MRKRQELESVKNFIDSTYNNWGNRLLVNTDKLYNPEHSKLGYCYKYIDPITGNVVYKIDCSRIGIERTDFRIMMHEYGHIYKGHMDEEYEELDTQICNVFRDHRVDIVNLIVKETGLDIPTAEKLIERVIDDPEINHSLHNIAMDMEVNSTVLSKEDIEEMEWDITSILPKYEEEMLKKSIENAQDEEYKKLLNEAYQKMLSEVKIKFMLPCRYYMGKDDQGNPKPFPDGLKYADYLILIIKHIDQFVKMMVSIKMGGNGDTSQVTQDDIMAALNGMLNQMKQRFQQNPQSEAYKEGYRQALRDARNNQTQQQGQESEEFKKGFQDGFKQQLGQMCGTENYKNGYQDGFQDEQSMEGKSQDYKDGFQNGQKDGKEGNQPQTEQESKSDDYNQGYQDGHQKGQERQQRDSKDGGQSDEEKQSQNQGYQDGYQDGQTAAKNQKQYGSQGDSKDPSQDQQPEGDGSGNDYQDGFNQGQQQASNMANGGQQNRNQGQGNQQGQNQGQQSGGGQSQEMQEYNQGYQDALKDLENCQQAGGGMQGLSDLMQQMGITQGNGNGDPGSDGQGGQLQGTQTHNKLDPGQKKGEGQEQKDTLNPFEGLGRCKDHDLDHKSDSRDAADERRKEGKIQAGGGVGCGKSGDADITREVDKHADEVDMAMGEVINDIKHRVIKQTLQRDVMKNYNRGVTRSIIAPSISRKISVSTNPKIVFLLDISGSMDTRLVDRILKTIAKSIKKINRDLRYDIITWSTHLGEHIKDIDPKKSVPRISCGGGTDLASGMEYFKNNYGPEAILVLISDFCDSLDEWHKVEMTMKNYSMWGFNYGNNRYSYKRGDWDWKYFKQRNFSNYGYDD